MRQVQQLPKKDNWSIVRLLYILLIKQYMKVSLPITLVLGGLLLVGAGCQQAPAPVTDTSTPPVTTDTSTTPTTTPEQPASDLSLSATSDTRGIVKASWNIPTNLPEDATFRLLHSSSPNVEFPKRAFWTALAKNKTALEWEGVPSGKRHFRICVFVKGACTEYSNEVEVNVK